MKKCCWNCDDYDSFGCVCHTHKKQIDHLEVCDSFKEVAECVF